MADKKMVAICVFNPMDRSGGLEEVEHGGSEMLGRNVVFANPDDLCDCKWCQLLRRRVTARTGRLL